MTRTDAFWRLAPVWLALIAAMIAFRPALAAEVEIERMTWIEVRDAIAAGARTVIVPTGGTEQNGAHMAIGKHNVIVAETARRIARALGDALVAPVLAYVPEGDPAKPTGHMTFAGTISVPDAAYMPLLEAIAASLKTHGFKTIVLLGDSGENQAPQRRIAEKLTRAWAGDGVVVMNADAYYAANGGDAYLLGDGESKATVGTHAGVRDTSELMAVWRAGVDLGKAKPDANGATGDASRASVARGEKLLAMKVDAAVAEIRQARAMPQRAAADAGFWQRLWR